MQLLALPLAFTGRAAAAWGRRLAGADGELVSAQTVQRNADQLFRVLGQLRGGAPARFGDHLGGRFRSKAGHETCGQSRYRAGVPVSSQQTAVCTRSGMLDRVDRPLHSRPPLKQTRS